MDALAALRAEAAIPTFVALARRRPADDVARRAQLALGKVATPAAVAALIALTRTPPVSPDTRAALRAAGAAAVPGLERELASGTPGSAAIAAATLGDIGDRHATAPLCAALERRAELAPVALDALARIGDRGGDPDAGARRPNRTISRPAGAPTRRCSRCAIRGLRSRSRAGWPTPTRMSASCRRVWPPRPARRPSAPAVASLLLDGEQDVRRAAAASLAVLAAPSSAAGDRHRRRDHEARRPEAGRRRMAGDRRGARTGRRTGRRRPTGGGLEERARGGTSGAGARARRRAGRPPVHRFSVAAAAGRRAGR